MIKCQLQLVGEIQSKSKEFFESRKFELMSAIKKQECGEHVKKASKIAKKSSFRSKANFLKLRKAKIHSKSEFELKKKFDPELVSVIKKPKKLENFVPILKVKKKLENMESDSEKMQNLKKKFDNFSELLKQKYLKAALIKSLGVLSGNNLESKSSKLASELCQIKELIFTSDAEKSKFYNFLTTFLMMKFNKNIYSSTSGDVTGDMLVYFLNQEVKSFNLTNQFLGNFAHKMTKNDLTTPEFTLHSAPAINVDIIASRNEKLKFLYRTLLEKGQDLEMQNLPDLQTMGKNELYKVKASFLEQKISN